MSGRRILRIAVRFGGNQKLVTQEKPPIPVTSCHHLALAVPDLDAAIAMFQSHFGLTADTPKDVPEQGIRIAYVDLGNLLLELMEPSADDSPISGFLAKRTNGGLHHICLTTPDTQAAFADTNKAGFATIGAGIQRGHHGRDLFFLDPRQTSGTLIEIEGEGQE